MQFGCSTCLASAVYAGDIDRVRQLLSVPQVIYRDTFWITSESSTKSPNSEIQVGPTPFPATSDDVHFNPDGPSTRSTFSCHVNPTELVSPFLLWSWKSAFVAGSVFEVALRSQSWARLLVMEMLLDSERYQIEDVAVSFYLEKAPLKGTCFSLSNYIIKIIICHS